MESTLKISHCYSNNYILGCSVADHRSSVGQPVVRDDYYIVANEHCLVYKIDGTVQLR